MLIPLAEYPVRPAMQEGESLAGYLYRFHSENGSALPFSFHNALQTLYHGSQERATFTYEEIQIALGESVRLDRWWWMQRSFEAIKSGKYDRTWRKLSFTPVRFCPECLRESNFHYAVWELPSITACPLHRCALEFDCWKCRTRLTWKRLEPQWHCRCGALLMLKRRKLESKDSIVLANLLCRANDIQPPNSFKKIEKAKSQLISYDSVDVHGTSRWIEKLRTKLTTLQRMECKGVYPVARRAYDFPDSLSLIIKILTRDRGYLSRLFFNSMHKRCQSQKTPLIFIAETDSLIAALGYLNELTEERHPFSRRIVEIAHEYLETWQIKISMSSILLLNSTTPLPEMGTRLASFAHWWFDLSNQMQSLDLSAYMSKEKIDGTLSQIDRSWKEFRIFEILETLLNASQRSVPIACFSGLINSWRIPEYLQRRFDPNDVLLQIGMHLANAPASEVAFVRDLVVHA